MSNQPHSEKSQTNGFSVFDSFVQHGRKPLSQSEILARYPEAEQIIISERLSQLTALACHIGRNFKMQVLLGIPGENSCWNPNTGDVYLDPDLLLHEPLEVLRFVVCHEGAHCRISCPDLIPKEVYSQIGFPLFYNYLEDPRTNNYQAQADRAFISGQKIFYENMLSDTQPFAEYLKTCGLNEPPRYLTVCSELLKAWFQLREYGEYKIDKTLPSELQAVITEVLPAAKIYWKIYPSKKEAEDRIRVTYYADLAHRHLIDNIWPKIKDLIDQDLANSDQIPQGKINFKAGKNFGQGEHNDGDGQQELILKFRALDKLFDSHQNQAKAQPGSPKAPKPDLSGPEFAEPENKHLIKAGPGGNQSPRMPEPKVPAGLEDMNFSLLENASDSVAIDSSSDDQLDLDDHAFEDEDELADQVADLYHAADHCIVMPLRPFAGFYEKQELDEEPLKFYTEKELVELSDLDSYLKSLQKTKPIIDPLHEELANHFRARARAGKRERLQDGVEPDIEQYIQELAAGIPIAEAQMWIDYKFPTIKDYAVTLLIDLSGSMQGKISQAQRALIVFAEVLFKLGINTEILGFNAGFYVFKPFGQDLNDQFRAKLGTLQHYIYTGSSGYNNDGYALELASERLKKTREKEKRLLVFSDGLPAPDLLHMAPKWELSNVIGKISAETNQLLYGLGIGPGTEHVKDYYPVSRENIPIEGLVRATREILNEGLVKRAIHINKKFNSKKDRK